jgi:DNA-binding IscR family transcriptional regulator
MQRIACHRAHGNEPRCACWLLKTADRVGDEAFVLTHATLATMLGVRRATVTDSLSVLQREGVVRSSRGTVTVLDRAALEVAACDCYPAFRRALPLTSTVGAAPRDPALRDV